MNASTPLSDFLKSEFERVKTEQAQRIAFRDNTLFVHLAATGAVASWAITNLDKPHALFGLLVVPWVCVIMGWTYVVNDYHISRMGKYVRTILEKRACAVATPLTVQVTEGDNATFEIAELFGWEPYHRIDKRRASRKKLQFFVDEFTFVLPGIASILGYLFLKRWSFDNHFITALLVLEIQALILIAVVIVSYADMVRGKT